MLTSTLVLGLVLSQACGTERWAIKTLTDRQAFLVGTAPTPSTVAQLTAMPAPPYSDERGRTVEPERTVYELTVYILGFKGPERDRDLHVVISDSPRAPIPRGAASGRGSRDTMVVELPDPACAEGSLRLSEIAKARQDFLRIVGKPPAPGRFKLLHPPRRVILRGVGFFDREHGQTGRAANVIELHPVLSVKPAG